MIDSLIKEGYQLHFTIYTIKYYIIGCQKKRKKGPLYLYHISLSNRIYTDIVDLYKYDEIEIQKQKKKISKVFLFFEEFNHFFFVKGSPLRKP